jgi:hypothetical protein
MRPAKILTVEKAKAIIEKEMDLDYEEVHKYIVSRFEIEDAIPRFLNLNLAGYKFIDDDAAKLIGEIADSASLPNLISISPRAAAYLAQHDCVLALDGLQHLTEEVARALCKSGLPLSLSGLTCISERVASLLAKRYISLTDCELVLNGLVELPDAIAQKLSQYFGILVLNGLTTLSPISARLLSQGYSKLLFLNSLTNLTGGKDDDVAFWLGRANMDLSLDGIKVLPASIAKHFSCGGYGVGFAGLTELADEVAELLVKRQGLIDLSGLTSLSETTAKILSTKEEGMIVLGIKSLPVEIAILLSSGACDLRLWKLETLDDDAAAALANHSGTLHIYGIKSISAKAAEFLAQHKGDLDIDLEQLTSEAREILAQRKSTPSDSGKSEEPSKNPTAYPFSQN